MGELRTIPLIFAITGHRDIQDRDQVQKSVTSLLQKYKDNHKNTPLILLSALADGADILVAQVAKSLDVELQVILPYERDDYLKTIEETESFDALMEYATRMIVLDCQADNRGKHTHCYQELGEHIADKSNILIALWDGKETSTDDGGTASIVHYQREYLYKNENMFDSKDGKVIHIIPTIREKDPEQKLDDLATQTQYLGRLTRESFEQNLDRVDNLNSEIKKSQDISSRTLLQKYKSFFGSQANSNQTTYKRWVFSMLGSIGLAIVFLEVMHVFYGAMAMRGWASHLVVGYFMFLISAWVIYKLFMRSDKLQDDFIFYRGLSEAIRVQNAWNATGLDRSVSDYYLKDEAPRLTWIRMVLKNIYYMDSSFYESGGEWIESQIAYFKKEIKNRKEKLKTHERAEHIFFLFGALAVVIIAIWYLLEVTHMVEHGAFPFNWHFVVLISGVALIFAGFAKKVLFIHGYQEEKESFEEMLPLFEKALNLLRTTKDPKTKKRVIFDLGKKALIENSQWVGLHDARRARFEME